MTSTALVPRLEAPSGPPQRISVWAVATIALLIAAASFACAWGLFARLDRVVDARAFWWALLFASIPVLPLTALFVWLDRVRPEPVWLLVSAMLYGGLAATLISLELNGWLARLIGDAAGVTPLSAVYVAPWVEEAAKCAVVFAIVIWRRHDFNAVVAGVVYGGLTGIAFAFTENVVYYAQIFQRAVGAGANTGEAVDAVQDLFLFRGVAAPFVHPMFTMLTGLGVGLAVRYRHVGVRILVPVAGYCGAVLLHMGYNTIASFATAESLHAVYLALLVPTLLTLVAVVLVVRRHERRVIAARLLDYTAFGWLKAEHVPYIVTARGRREARRHVRPLGRAERDRLRTFQRSGMDLGLLRDRLVRGVAGPAALPRERVLIATLRGLRGRVSLPNGAGAGSDELSSTASSW